MNTKKGTTDNAGGGRNPQATAAEAAKFGPTKAIPLDQYGSEQDATITVGDAIDDLVKALDRLHEMFGDDLEFDEIQIRFDDDKNRRRIAQRFAGNPIVDWLVRPWRLQGKRPTLTIGQWWDLEDED